jgi:hypothetical protein
MTYVRVFRPLSRLAFGTCLLAVAARAEPADLISRNAGGAAADQVSTFSSIAKNGRLVFFQSRATNLAASDTDTDYDLYLRDRLLGTVEHLRCGDGGTDIDGDVYLVDVSRNGRYVAFYTAADDVIPGVSPNGSLQGYVLDRKTGATILATRTHDGQPLSESIYNVSMSGNGRFVAFATSAPYVVPNVAVADELAYVFDVQEGTTELVSVDEDGNPATEDCFVPTASDDGRYVFFRTKSTSLDPSVVDSNVEYDIYRRDRSKGVTQLVSLGTAGLLSESSGEYAISADGRRLFFVNSGDVVGDGGLYNGLYVRDLREKSTQRVADSTIGKAPGGIVGGRIACDKRGRNVTFVSYYSNLVEADPNGAIRDVFLADTKKGVIELLSFDALGGGISDECWHVAIGANGKAVTFASDAIDLTPTPIGGKQQIFLVER